MSTLLTGAFRRVGTAFIDNAAADHEFTYLDTIEHPELPTEVVYVVNFPAFEAAAAGNNAIVHLAAASG